MYRDIVSYRDYTILRYRYRYLRVSHITKQWCNVLSVKEDTGDKEECSNWKGGEETRKSALIGGDKEEFSNWRPTTCMSTKHALQGLCCHHRQTHSHLVNNGGCYQ